MSYILRGGGVPSKLARRLSDTSSPVPQASSSTLLDKYSPSQIQGASRKLESQLLVDLFLKDRERSMCDRGVRHGR